MSAAGASDLLDDLNVATRNYIQRNASKLVDNVFQTSPLVSRLRRVVRIDEFAAETGTTACEAELASRVIDKMANSP